MPKRNNYNSVRDDDLSVDPSIKYLADESDVSLEEPDDSIAFDIEWGSETQSNPISLARSTAMLFEQGNFDPALVDFPKEKINFFLSHVQSEAGRAALLFKTEVEKLGHTCWLDVCASDKSIQGMENGVKNCDFVIVFVTKSYISRKACLKELNWAMEYGKKVQPVHLPSDKPQIGVWRNLTPAPYRWIFERNFLCIDDTDTRLLSATLPIILNDTKKTSKAPSASRDAHKSITDIECQQESHMSSVTYTSDLTSNKTSVANTPGSKYASDAKCVLCTPSRFAITLLLLAMSGIGVGLYFYFQN